MRILHVSDLHYWHITLNPLRLAGKRFLGMSNLLLNRAWKFRREALPALVAYARELRPDHIIFTGDLTTTALEEEFIAVRAALEPLSPTPSMITMIAGNHDRYTRTATHDRLFEKYFGEYAPERAFPWVKRLGTETAILGLDACPRARISARGSISVDQLDKALHLLEAVKPPILHLLVMCHYPVALPDGVKEAKGHGLEGTDDLRRFLQSQGPLLFCHGHVHIPWVYSPPDLSNVVCLNPGAAIQFRSEEGTSGRLLEIVLDGRDAEIKRHSLRDYNWDVSDNKRFIEFFANRSAV